MHCILRYTVFQHDSMSKVRRMNEASSHDGQLVNLKHRRAFFPDRPIPCHMLFLQPSAYYYSLHNDNLPYMQQTFSLKMFDLQLCGGLGSTVVQNVIGNSMCNFKLLYHGFTTHNLVDERNEMSQYHRQYILTHPVNCILVIDTFKGACILNLQVSTACYPFQ